MANSPHRADTPVGRRQGPSGWGETASWDKTVVAQPVLVILSVGELQGRILELQPGTQVIGRQPGCELRIDDGFVSRRHAIVMRDRDTSWLEDAGSANGTSLNGEQLLRGRRRPLRSGDLIRIGRIDLVYLDGSETPTRRQALLQPPKGVPPVEVLSRPSTDDTPPLQPLAMPAPHPKPKADASPLTPVQLVLSAAAASVTALLLSRLNVNQLGTTIGAGLTTVVTTFLQTRGRKQWLRVATGAGLALALAVTGVTLPQVAFGSENRPLTFVPPKLDPRPTVPDISVDPNPVDCGAMPVGQEATCSAEIRSIGSAPLRVTSIDEPTGPASGEFRVSGSDCLGESLAPGKRCTVEVTFQPAQAGPRSARLTVHQNLPKPDTGTQVDLTGEGLDEPPPTGEGLDEPPPTDTALP
jgi:pSer/pThr/pTyr-binding forkhead associated (FHA) protein